MAIKMKEEDVKIHMTITIDKDIKKRFNIACAILSLTMSEAISAMIENFLDISSSEVNKEASRLSNIETSEQEIIFTESSRLKEE